MKILLLDGFEDYRASSDISYIPGTIEHKLHDVFFLNKYYMNYRLSNTPAVDVYSKSPYINKSMGIGPAGNINCLVIERTNFPDDFLPYFAFDDLLNGEPKITIGFHIAVGDVLGTGTYQPFCQVSGFSSAFSVTFNLRDDGSGTGYYIHPNGRTDIYCGILEYKKYYFVEIYIDNVNEIVSIQALINNVKVSTNIYDEPYAIFGNDYPLTGITFMKYALPSVSSKYYIDNMYLAAPDVDAGDPQFLSTNLTGIGDTNQELYVLKSDVSDTVSNYSEFQYTGATSIYEAVQEYNDTGIAYANAPGTKYYCKFDSISGALRIVGIQYNTFAFTDLERYKNVNSIHYNGSSTSVGTTDFQFFGDTILFKDTYINNPFTSLSYTVSEVNSIYYGIQLI